MFHYPKVAYLGHAVGPFSLGIMYLKGIGIANDDSAVFWYQKSAEQESAYASFSRCMRRVVVFEKWHLCCELALDIAT